MMIPYTRLLHPAFSLLLPFLLLNCALHAQPAQRRFQHTLDSVLDLQPLNSKTPGFSVCIVENGQIIYEKQAGMANIGRKIPVMAKTVFNIGSLSKQFTAMCILLLEEEGKLNRNDDIHLYLPELPDYGYPITIRQLMDHTSGIRGHLEVLEMQNKTGNKRLRNRYMLDYEQKHPALNFPPGEDFSYSNTGYMMLCAIVERVSGMTIHAFAQQRIFDPLGMHDTYFQEEGKKGVAGETASYSIKSNGKKFKKEPAFMDALGATGVHATLRDMVLWDQNFYHNILGKGNRELIAAMETPGKLNAGNSTFYGGGLFLRQRHGYPEIEHTGGWGSFCAQYRQFPEQQVSVFTVSNSELPSAFSLNDIICNVLFRQISDVTKIPKCAAQLPSGFAPEQFTGIYLSDNNWIRQVKWVDSSLFIVMGTAEKAAKRRLTYCGNTGNLTMFLDTFNNPTAFLKYDNHITQFKWSGGHYFPGARTYQKLNDTSIPDPAAYAGVYSAPDFGRKVKIKYHKRSNNLSFHQFPFVKYHLKSIVNGVYQIPGQTTLLRFGDNQLVIGDMWNRGIVMRKK